MPKYLLEVIENNGYLIEVEAASPEAAEEMYDNGELDVEADGRHVHGENFVESVEEVK